jgi:hypothetical protein
VEPELKKISHGVVLPPEHTGSSLFHAVLADTLAKFPDVLSQASLPEQRAAWKRNYGSLLARFEAHRVASPRRVEIARFMLHRAQSALLFGEADGALPLAEYLSAPAESPALTTIVGDGTPGFSASLPLDGKVYRGAELLDRIERLHRAGDLTERAIAALRWTIQHIEAQGGVLDLRGQRFAILGAGAELAATRLLLAAGATVLWVDVTDPNAWLAANGSVAGDLVYAQSASNLLEQPRAIRAAIERFAADGPVHLGLFAYASGATQEWRLGASMNAIAGHLDPNSLRSISMLVSPTTVPTLQSESIAHAQQLLAAEPVWKSALSHAGILPKPGFVAANGTKIGLSTVSIQGLSYQAAQYLSKLAAAETYGVYGAASPDNPRALERPVTVSANVAGITRTRSLSHPLFEAAFIGASRFSVRIFDPDTTRALSGLLMLHDLLNPNAPGSASVQASASDKASALHAQQIHGGIYNLPYPLEHAIRVAAVIGMGSKPSVLLRRSARPAAEARA